MSNSRVSQIDWCTFLQYLCVKLTSSKTFTVDTDPLKRSFYAACNSIYSQTATLNDLVSLSLQESYCLPILNYACAAISLKPKQAALQSLMLAGMRSIGASLISINGSLSEFFFYGLGRLNRKVSVN